MMVTVYWRAFGATDVELPDDIDSAYVVDYVHDNADDFDFMGDAYESSVDITDVEE